MPIALVALLSSAALAGPASGTAVCQNARPNVAAGSLYDPAHGARAERLGELPPADLILTVLRRENGCERPVIVRYSIGDTSKARR